MKELTVKESEKVYEKYLNKITIKKLRDFLLVHSKKVKEMAILLGKRKNLDTTTLEIAGLVHDIGYVIDEKEHPQHSLKILKDEGYKVSEILKDCILNHSHDKVPLTTEGKIFQIADKISIFDKETLHIFLKHNNAKINEEDIAFLEIMITNSISFMKEIN